MPRNRQPITNNPYLMDHDLYMQMVYLIRGYPNLLSRKQEILYGSPPPPDGMPRGNGTSNPTENKAITLAVINEQLKAIEQTMMDLKGRYQNTFTGEEFQPYDAFIDKGVFSYYRSSRRKDSAPCDKTWNRYRSEFAYKVAKKLNYF